MVVCHCERVNDRTIRQLIDDAALSIDDVIAGCGAGGRCGGCRSTIERLLDDALVRTGAPVPVTVG